MVNKRPKKEEDEAQQRILNRISRIEGQLKGIRRMIESKDECLDVITQVMAARSATSMLGIELIKEDLLCRKGQQREIDETYLKTLFSLN